MVTALTARVLTTVHHAAEDRRIFSSSDQCRTSSRFTPEHPEWELMFDSYDYKSLVASVFLSREFDNDGDVWVR